MCRAYGAGAVLLARTQRWHAGANLWRAYGAMNCEATARCRAEDPGATFKPEAEPISIA
jgi:hypothetical protein